MGEGEGGEGEGTAVASDFRCLGARKPRAPEIVQPGLLASTKLRNQFDPRRTNDDQFMSFRNIFRFSLVCTYTTHADNKMLHCIRTQSERCWSCVGLISTNIITGQRRFYKEKWVMNRKKKTHTELALNHFDTFYSPVYNKLWPSIRLALLSPQKYGAIVNNFSADADDIESKLCQTGANNAVLMAVERLNQVEKLTTKSSDDGKVGQNLGNIDISDGTHKIQDWHDNDIFLDESVGKKVKTTGDSLLLNKNIGQKEESERFETNDVSIVQDGQNLMKFMPTTKVYSEKELLYKEESRQSVYTPKDIPIVIVKERMPYVPKNLRMMVYPKGNISEFASPRPDRGGLLAYYLMDASSVLPVIALDLHPNDKILDLCAAPGGKSLSVLQTLLTENLTCSDSSQSRMFRLQKVFHSYLTESTKQNVVQQVCDGIAFREPVYDKVLVDVPCNTDRHVLTYEDNNLFKPGRIQDRIHLPELQKKLLIAGIKSCKPGGSIVYSTCTLSPSQNDGVIQSAFEEIWKTSKIDIVVQNLKELAEGFQDIFKFHKGCQFGQLVLPSISANFGPMYFCKINRQK
ncbi:hypothetical protein CHS0354_036540 [Potamilus streckersoni]|uniref:NOL1/NOP2/Sun domain family member 4 n=1 Tax=Potamilus streckersoni TaxID=2493646 RepID=A0AAE0TAG8_9BIVA|nr:hypothetical protein CHS0354_036540 [Potamilus streckersoni]